MENQNTIAETIYQRWLADYRKSGACIEWLCLAAAIATTFDAWEVPTYHFKDGSSLSTEEGLVFVGDPIEPTV